MNSLTQQLDATNAQLQTTRSDFEKTATASAAEVERYRQQLGERDVVVANSQQVVESLSEENSRLTAELASAQRQTEAARAALTEARAAHDVDRKKYAENEVGGIAFAG